MANTRKGFNNIWNSNPNLQVTNRSEKNTQCIGLTAKELKERVVQIFSGTLW
jgi:hypothetical protein